MSFNMETGGIGQSLREIVGCSNKALYSALPGSGIIRLVKILPGDWDEDIVCEIFQTPLGTITPYKALSYAWQSDQTESHTEIVCNGVDVEVSVNLFHALRQLRNVQVPVVIWVDFLCINQQDVVERSLQVAMMREIYEKSREVIIWLGERRESDQLEEWWRDQRVAQPVERACLIEWYDDERDLPKVDPYLQAFKNTSTFSSTRPRDVYGAFCIIQLLSQGVAPANIHFLRHVSLAAGVVAGIWALMSQSWVRSIFLNFHASDS
jgi:hypothetical protein